MRNYNNINVIDLALIEDIGKGDITSTTTIPEGITTKFVIRAREEMVVCGTKIVQEIFSKIKSKGKVNIKIHLKDGEVANSEDIIISGKGDARAVMAGERTALNFLRQLSGVATSTKEFVEAVKGTKAIILDTRKTIPGLRQLQKYAVTIGGGNNHRFGLDDGILIKDNHIAICGGVKKAIESARKNAPKKFMIEIECDTFAQAKEAAAAGADIILLDNMDIKTLQKVVKFIDKKILLEASGGITLKNIRQIAQTGVDFISVGSITNNPANIDIGLDME